MSIQIKSFRVTEGHKIRLRDWPTRVNSFFKSKPRQEQFLSEHVGK